jgi:FKBP-type peptidyl-prolyl cis-trans isomerase FklB
MNKVQEEKVKPNLAAGKKFLDENKKRPEVKTTPSGLQYEVLVEGTGPKPKATDKVTVQYRGTFLNGTEFDSSFKTGQPVTFALNGVITGWTEGLQLMSVGSKYKFYVPYNLGYGMYDYNSIPGGSTLIFEVELLNVVNNPAQ